MKIFYTTFLCILFPVLSFGQNTAGHESLTVGMEFPPVTFHNVDHFAQREVPLESLRGKYVILDFWSLGCSSCFTSFKNMKTIQEKFKDKLQFFLIGSDRVLGKIVISARAGYEMYKDMWGFDFPVTYDASLHQKIEIPFYPHYVWIDDKGIIKARTTSMEITEKNIETFLNGGEVVIDNPLHTPGTAYDYKKPLLLNGNGGADSAFLFRSILAKWNSDSPRYFQYQISTATNEQGRTFHTAIQKNRVQANGVSLRHLIQMAYGDTLYSHPAYYSPESEKTMKYYSNSSYGKYWSEPILEVRDSSAFAFDPMTGKNGLSYSLIVPPAMGKAEFLRKTMQKDLSTYFPYSISVEVRTMPCWNLTATEDARIKLITKTKDRKYRSIGGISGLMLRNIPIYELIHQIADYTSVAAPIIDRTNIQTHIDLELTAIMLEFSAVQKALAEQGLYLEKGHRKMKVIVVRDIR